MGFRAISRDRLVRMAWGTYHTDQTGPRPSCTSWAEGKPSALRKPSKSASGWAEAKSDAACRAAWSST